VKISADFVTSAVDAAGFPKERLPELALVGRSNVGKSSLINALVRQKVARTSAAPGKTRLANFYRVAPEGIPPFYLVDLPGYGYARGHEAAQREFQAITSGYFGRNGARKRGQTPLSDQSSGKKGSDPFFALFSVLLLVDSRHPGLDQDLQAWSWLKSLDVPSAIVATKVDKLSRAERARHFKELERIHESPVLGVSVHTGEGLKELWEQIATRLRPTPPKTPQPPLPPPRPTR
jgi:GTP-binding protein